MRAGLIIGGAFLMFIGAVLFFTFIFSILGMFFGLIGFIMLIVGLFTSTSERVVVTSSPQVTVYGASEKRGISDDTKYCSRCGAKNLEDARFCFVCGKSFTKPISSSSEEKTKILAICPECKNRIDSNSKFCPECGTNLQPLNK